MKKFIVYFVLVLGLSLLFSCEKQDNAVPELTYSFVPGYNSGHMFDIYEVNQDGSKHGLLLEATNVGFNQPDWSADGTVMAI